MINTYDIKELKHRLKPLDPPHILLAFHHFPVIQRISPQLPCCAEIIGRHPCDNDRFALRIEKKQFTMTPDIRGIVANKNRNITNNCDSFASCIRSQSPPLSEKLPLDIFLDAYLRA